MARTRHPARHAHRNGGVHVARASGGKGRSTTVPISSPLGLILYEMATGELAFRRDTAAQTLASIIESDVPSLLERNPACPPGLERVVSRCLRKDRELRYADTQELLREMSSIRADEPRPTPAPPATASASSRRGSRGAQGSGGSGGRAGRGHGRRALRRRQGSELLRVALPSPAAEEPVLRGRARAGR